MEQTVYADLFFMINFSMDFLCFYLASRLLGAKLSVPRAVIASALGGIYADLALIWGLSGALGLAADILSCALMCAVAFGARQRVRRLPIYILVYVAVSMTLGGFMTAIFNLLNRTSLGAVSSDGDGISAWLLVILAVVSAALTLLGGRFFRRRTSKRNVRLKITLGGKDAELTALCDSGNMLREPISGKLCVIASVDALGAVLPRGIRETVKNGGRNMSDLAASDLGLRVIPTTTATGEGMLFAVYPDRISVEDGKDEYTVDALLALSGIGDISDGAQALFPTELLA